MLWIKLGIVLVSIWNKTVIANSVLMTEKVTTLDKKLYVPSYRKSEWGQNEASIFPFLQGNFQDGTTNRREYTCFIWWKGTVKVFLKAKYTCFTWALWGWGKIFLPKEMKRIFGCRIALTLKIYSTQRWEHNYNWIFQHLLLFIIQIGRILNTVTDNITEMSYLSFSLLWHPFNKEDVLQFTDSISINMTVTWHTTLIAIAF